MTDDKAAAAIDVKLTKTNFYTRWPCHVCGGHTEKVNVLAEADDGFRVCENCLQAGDIDKRLARYASKLDDAAAEVRALIGRVRVPSYAEWEAMEKRVDVAIYAAHSMDSGENEYDRVMADDLAYARWRPGYDAEMKKLWPPLGDDDGTTGRPNATQPPRKGQP